MCVYLANFRVIPLLTEGAGVRGETLTHLIGVAAAPLLAPE